jgi:protein O-GlcNAc transferase
MNAAPLALQWQRALAAYRSGNLALAERLCGEIARARRDFFDALHLLALVQAAQGKGEAALASFRRALALRPNDVETLNNCGVLQGSLGMPAEALASFERALAVRPDHWQALDNRATALARLGRRDDAAACLDRMLRLRPNDADTLNRRGNLLREMKRPADALACYDRALAAQPDHADALGNRGNALHELGRLEEALASYDGVIARRPKDVAALNLRGIVLKELGRHDAALASFERALALAPAHVDALNNRGAVLQITSRHDEALASFERALAARPDHAEALRNRAGALRALGRSEEALQGYDRAVAARPGDAEAWNGRGVVLGELQQQEAALDSAERALALRPDLAEAWNNRGNALSRLRRLEEALESYDRAIALRPDYPTAFNNRGVVLHRMKRYEEAVASFDRALARNPDDVEALNNRGNAPYEQGRYDEALASYDRALAAAPDHADALSGAANCVSELCVWERAAAFAADLPARVERGLAVNPFVLLRYTDDPAIQRRAAQNTLERQIPRLPPPVWRGERWRHDRLRLAYLAADFSFARRGADDFARHDRARFEVIGVSYGADDPTLVAAFDRFHDVRGKSDAEAASLLRALEIDIVVDRQGHTANARLGILAHRPAPIQATYLAYPGTTGASFIDYIIADEIIAPFTHQPFYAERIVHLPDCYQVNDTSRSIAAATPSRAAMGLPEQGFVFCCFNNNWKIAPPVFEIWMRLMRQVEGSVLWLLRSNDGADRNLRREAARRGIDPTRLVFAERIPLAEHLARHRLADLFLDTLPYNAHTTASDALWAGTPVLTCAGRAFAARVGASMLRAAGLPELIASDLAEYERLALGLAQEPARLAAIKARLAAGVGRCALFDTTRFARHLEAAYLEMWQKWQRGGPPESFAVAPIG